MKKWIVLLILGIIAIGLSGLNWSVSGELTTYLVCKQGLTTVKSIQVENLSDTTLILNLTPSDYAGKMNGSPIFIPAGKLDRSNSSWIRLKSNRITIPPSSRQEILYSISVPADKVLMGSYWSVLFLEEENPNLNSGSLILKQRVAVQIITQIEETGTIKLDYEKFEFNHSQDELLITLRNNGTRWINSTLQIDLFNSEGTKIGRYFSEPVRLYPQAGTPLKIPVDKLNKGKYVAVCVVDCGNNKIFGSQFNLEK